VEIKNLEKNEADVQEKIDFLKQELAQIQEQITQATENMKAIDQQIQFIDNYKIELEVKIFQQIRFYFRLCEFQFFTRYS
jgi:septal ring factor EnvC (AmiA/AmiB activator)